MLAKKIMKYSAKKEILSCNDLAEIAWMAIEPLWDDLPLSNASKLRVFMSEITNGQKALISIDWCQKEIRNGGIKQLFLNSTGNLVPYAIEGYNLIGANIYSENLLKASKLLGCEYPKSCAARKRAIKLLTQSQMEQLNKLEDDFFELIDSTDNDIEKYRGGYVKSNSKQFITC